MSKSVLIVGSGDIAKKHRKSLRLISNKIKIKNIASRQFQTFLNTNHKKLYFNFIIVCSPSSEHHRHINLIENNFKKIKVLIEKPENLDLFSLFHYIKMMNDSGLNISNHIIYLLKILLQPILMISMVLISASLILRDNERKFPISVISITLIIGFIIYFIADLILALGSMEKINPILAGVGPSMLSLFAGCFLVSSFDEIK